MRWFGGHEGPGPVPRPVGTRYLWPDDRSVWLSQDFPTGWIRTAESPIRRIALIGVCDAPTQYMRSLVEQGVPDNVAWLWSGSYIAVESSAEGTRVWTDLGSANPIYVRAYGDATVWASSARLLASLDGMELDLDHLVHWFDPPGTGTPGSASTHFTGARRVPTGHRFDMAASGQHRMHQTWDSQPAADMPHAQNLRSALEGAVHARLQSVGTVTSDLSGGFGSTALALIAAEHTQSSTPFPALTCHPEGVTTGGDLDYAREAATNSHLTQHMLALGPGEAPYQNFANIPASDEPAPSTITFAYLRHQLAWLHQFGSDLHMTGDGGDTLFSTPLEIVNDLVRLGHTSRAVTETARWAQLRNSSFVQAWRSIRSQPEGGSPLPAWFTAEAAERHRSRLLTPLEGIHTGSAVGDHILHGMSEIGRSAHSDVQVARAVGVELHNPYTDSHIIDTYLRIPAPSLPSPTRYKPVLAQAMSDLFPARLLARTTKGDSTSGHYRGLRDALPELRTLMDGHLRELGLIDLPALHRNLTQAAAGTGPPLYQLKNTIAAEVWIRSLSTAPTTRWENPCPTS